MTSTPGSDEQDGEVDEVAQLLGRPRIIVPSVVEASGSPQPSSSTVSS